MALMNFQKELVLGGKTNLVDDTSCSITASELTKIMGHKNPDKFFNDPQAKDPQTGQPLHPPSPPPPDPAMLKVQDGQGNEGQGTAMRGQEIQANAQIASRPMSARRRSSPCRRRPILRRRTASCRPKWRWRSRSSSLSGTEADGLPAQEADAREMQDAREQHQQIMQAAGVFKVAQGQRRTSRRWKAGELRPSPRVVMLDTSLDAYKKTAANLLQNDPDDPEQLSNQYTLLSTTTRSPAQLWRLPGAAPMSRRTSSLRCSTTPRP
jgi:hypothetical protein